jgi:hypothetical protein
MLYRIDEVWYFEMYYEYDPTLNLERLSVHMNHELIFYAFVRNDYIEQCRTLQVTCIVDSEHVESVIYIFSTLETLTNGSVELQVDRQSFSGEKLSNLELK